MSYFITREGEVFIESKQRNALRYRLDGDPAVYVAMDGNHCRVSRAVLMAFKPIKNPEKFCARHIDGDYDNCHIDNLEWITKNEAMRDSHAGRKRGVHALGKKFIATLTHQKKTHYIGSYKTKKDAYEAYYDYYVFIHGKAPW